MANAFNMPIHLIANGKQPGKFDAVSYADLNLYLPFRQCTKKPDCCLHDVPDHLYGKDITPEQPVHLRIF